MAKFYGKVGYTNLTETSPGVWKESYVEKEYYGDTKRLSRSLEAEDRVNDNITISTLVSIVADPYALQHFFDIRYVEYMGVKWKVNRVDVSYPRLDLTLGDRFHDN